MRFKCAGIVLYNPDLERLHKNYISIYGQVEVMILIDNNSKNISEIREIYSTKKNVIIIENCENLGIATALNQLSDEAIKLGFNWIYLLDQDSISSSTIIDSYSQYIKNDKVALLTPYIVDMNKMSVAEYKNLNLDKISEVEWAITSGSMINLAVWKEIGKFSEELFIDAVDIDYGIRLSITGYKQLKVNSEYLLQEVGHAEPTFLIRPHRDNTGKWTLQRYYRSNHSLMRQYYMIRNNIILIRKYKKYRSLFKGIIFINLFILSKILFEKNRLKVLHQIIRGIRDGIDFDISKI